MSEVLGQQNLNLKSFEIVYSLAFSQKSFNAICTGDPICNEGRNDAVDDLIIVITHGSIPDPRSRKRVN